MRQIRFPNGTELGEVTVRMPATESGGLTCLSPLTGANSFEDPVVEKA